MVLAAGTTIMIATCAVVFVLHGGGRADAPPGHFTTLGDGTVRDNETGLVWQQGVSPSAQGQAASMTYCADLSLAGGGWRLPSILELGSIVDETRSTPAIDPTVFSGTPSELFWSASSVAGSPSLGWFVNFSNGIAYYTTLADPIRARCVR